MSDISDGGIFAQISFSEGAEPLTEAPPPSILEGYWGRTGMHSRYMFY